MLTYPHINPIAISIGPIFGLGPLRVHWYGIMYLIGFAAAWWLARYRARKPGSTWSALDIDDLIFYCAIGVIAGGRLGWCIFYGHDVIAENWLNVFHIWDGGMSFHGGMTGVLGAAIVFARVKRKRVADVLDFLAPLPGIGLLAGRLGNFINGELWGKPTDLPGLSACRTPPAYWSPGIHRSFMKRAWKDWCYSPCCGGLPAGRGPGWPRRVCFCSCTDVHGSPSNGCACRMRISGTLPANG